MLKRLPVYFKAETSKGHKTISPNFIQMLILFNWYLHKLTGTPKKKKHYGRFDAL